MELEELIHSIEDYLSAYDAYGFYDTYDAWQPNDASYAEVKSQITKDPEFLYNWFKDASKNGNTPKERKWARQICNALKPYISSTIQSSTDLFGEDPDFFFTRDDIIDYIETPLEEQIPEIESCRGYIDKEDGKYVLSVDIVTEDYDLTGVAAPAVTIDMRKIRKPSDLSRYLTPIIQIYNDTVGSFDELAGQALDPYFDDPTQYGDLDNPITPWGGNCI